MNSRRFQYAYGGLCDKGLFRRMKCTTRAKKMKKCKPYIILKNARSPLSHNSPYMYQSQWVTLVCTSMGNKLFIRGIQSINVYQRSISAWFFCCSLASQLHSTLLPSYAVVAFKLFSSQVFHFFSRLMFLEKICLKWFWVVKCLQWF